MRTTIEMSDAQRAKLLELAAERGEKGFSSLIREAVDQYLASNAARRDRVRAAQAVLGTLGEDEADSLEEIVRANRSAWR